MPVTSRCDSIRDWIRDSDSAFGFGAPFDFVAEGSWVMQADQLLADSGITAAGRLRVCATTR